MEHELGRNIEDGNIKVCWGMSIILKKKCQSFCSPTQEDNNCKGWFIWQILMTSVPFRIATPHTCTSCVFPCGWTDALLVTIKISCIRTLNYCINIMFQSKEMSFVAEFAIKTKKSGLDSPGFYHWTLWPLWYQQNYEATHLKLGYAWVYIYSWMNNSASANIADSLFFSACVSLQEVTTLYTPALLKTLPQTLQV